MGVRFVLRACESKKPGTEIEFPFEQARIVLGRGVASDVRIPHRTVSELHATVQLRGDAWQIVDAGSTNGTKLNGQAIAPDRAKRLRDNDVIQVGAYEFSFHPGVLVLEPVSAERTAELARRLLRDVQRAHGEPIAPPRLCVVGGANTGATLEIGPVPSRASIGAGRQCALVLADPSVAAEHAEIVRDLDGVSLRRLEDNAIDFAGQRVRSRRLRDGDEFSIGETRLLFEEPAQIAIDALKSEPDLPLSALQPAPVEAATPQPRAAEPVLLEPTSGMHDFALSGRSEADILIYALAAIVLIASSLGLMLLMR